MSLISTIVTSPSRPFALATAPYRLTTAVTGREQVILAPGISVNAVLGNPLQPLAIEDIYRKRIIVSIWVSLVMLWVPWVTSRGSSLPAIHVPPMFQKVAARWDRFVKPNFLGFPLSFPQPDFLQSEHTRNTGPP